MQTASSNPGSRPTSRGSSRTKTGSATRATSPRSSPPSASTSTRPARPRRRAASCGRCSTRPPGYEGDPKLLTAFPTECHGGANCEIAQVVEGPIPFFALCEHHALPFFGNVYVGYVAHEGIIGISKLTRLVRVVTRRFGVQERMTYQIADELDRMMAPHGVAVYVEAHHLCTQMRGVRELHPKTRTTSYRGVYVDSPQLRGEFFDVSGLRRAES